VHGAFACSPTLVALPSSRAWTLEGGGLVGVGGLAANGPAVGGRFDRSLV
jgi:hypothetical protein